MKEILDHYGELHVTLDSGDRYHLHKHDVTVNDGTVVVDSRKGRWTFDVESIENTEYPDSHKE